VTFPVLFVCICVLNYCHRVATQLQLNISYHIIYLKQCLLEVFRFCVLPEDVRFKEATVSTCYGDMLTGYWTQCVICVHLCNLVNGFLLFIAVWRVTILNPIVKTLLLQEIMLYSLPYVKVLNMQYKPCVILLGRFSVSFHTRWQPLHPAPT